MRRNMVYILLAAVWLAVAGWQAFEHRRVDDLARQNLARRAHDLSAALSVVIRSQGRIAFVPRPRIEAALDELVNSTELESVVLLTASGEETASAGKPLSVDAATLLRGHEHWTRDSATFANLIALGPGTEGFEEMPPGPPPGFRHRGPSWGRGGGPPRFDDPEEMLMAPHLDSLITPENRQALMDMMGEQPLDDQRVDRILGLFNEGVFGPRRVEALRQRLLGRPFNRETLRDLLMMLVGPPPGPPPEQPHWMNKPEYDRVVREHGVHWFLVTMPTAGVRAQTLADLRLRGIVLGGALLACLALALAWRAMGHSADLQIQLVREREGAARLRELNITAAGLVHETKNPLNLIRGMAQMIGRNPAATDELRDTATRITEESDRVAGRINQFLDYARPARPVPARVDVNGLLRSMVSILAFDCEEKNVAIEVTGPQIVVQADEGMLRQALFNLLLNAVQAVPKGGRVNVRLTVEPDKKARIDVCDNGPGIPPGLREEIFRPYYTTSEKGTGLGLAVVRRIALAHQWEVHCVDGGAGAVFRIQGIRLADGQTGESSNG